MTPLRPASASQTIGQRLIFRWPERSASFVLPSLFLASVAAHALTFYVFQVVYPTTVSIAPPPTQVTLLPPSSPENKALLRWVDGQDPAAAARLQEATPPKLGEIHYSPSYAAARTLPELAEQTPETISFPQAQDSLALIAPTTTHGDSPHTVVHSSLTLSKSLQARDAAPGEAVVPGSKSSLSLQPTTFLIGISDRGELRYCFLQNGSGDSVIDQEGEKVLRQHAFKRTDSPNLTEWGFATFVWGAEAFAPPPDDKRH